MVLKLLQKKFVKSLSIFMKNIEENLQKKFPFILGFNKIIIRTESEKMRRFLCKLTKYGVNYLFKHYDNYLFEVS